MMRYALGCFVAGSVAGVFAFVGETQAPLAEALFLLFFLAGLVLIGWGDPRNCKKRLPRLERRFSRRA
jgi:hypothetical protein